MKQISMAAIFMALLLGGSTSCTKDNSGTAAVNTSAGIGNVKGDPGVITATLEQGRWLITSYSGMSGSNTDFSGFQFTFSEGNYVAAINGEVVYNGNWSVDEEAHNLFMDFGVTPPPLTALKGNWQAIQVNANAVRLQRSDGSASFTFQQVVPAS